MVAIVSDELREKIEADALVTFNMVIDDAIGLYKNFSELTLIEKDEKKIVLLRQNVFKICNLLPFDITLIVGYPNAESFYRTEAEAHVKEIAWEDFKRLQRESNPAVDEYEEVE